MSTRDQDRVRSANLAGGGLQVIIEAMAGAAGHIFNPPSRSEESPAREGGEERGYPRYAGVQGETGLFPWRKSRP